MIPSVYDILAGTGALLPPSPCCLHRPGEAALNLSISLSQLGIAEGSLLIMAPATAAPPPVEVLHATDAVEDTARRDPGEWTMTQSRPAALLIAITMAATIGLVAVPGAFGAPSLLLGAASATAAAAIGARVTHQGRTALLAVTTMGALSTIATFGATLLDVRGSATGAALAVMSIGVLSVPGRLAVAISGLSAYVGPDLDPEGDGPDDDVWRRSVRAQQLLTALVVGASAAATFGCAAVSLGADRPLPDHLVSATLAALLTVRSRAHHHWVRRSALLAGGMLCTTTLFVGLRLGDPGLAPWLCGAAVLVAAGALWLGYAPSLAVGAAPVRRGLDLLDCLLLVAVLPLACWSSGLYDVVRGLSL